MNRAGLAAKLQDEGPAMNVIETARCFSLDLDGIIHVGANSGQERVIYRDAGAKTVLFIEPIEAVFRQLQENLRGFEGQIAFKALCSNRNGDVVRFNIASNGGESSSMFDLGVHADIYPGITYTRQEEMRTRTLDSIIETDFPRIPFNVLVIDVQGAEIQVLEGAASVLERVDAIFLEVSEVPLYKGGCTVDEVWTFLLARGFRIKWLNIGRDGWGDAFFLREQVCDDTPPPDAGSNIALNKPAKQSSTSPWSRANDAQGAVNGVFSSKFGFHTNLEDNPW